MLDSKASVLHTEPMIPALTIIAHRIQVDFERSIKLPSRFARLRIVTDTLGVASGSPERFTKLVDRYETTRIRFNRPLLGREKPRRRGSNVTEDHRFRESGRPLLHTRRRRYTHTHTRIDTRRRRRTHARAARPLY